LPAEPDGVSGGGEMRFNHRYRPPSHPELTPSTGSSATNADHTLKPVDVSASFARARSMATIAVALSVLKMFPDLRSQSSTFRSMQLVR
jgi:hypothetical protein